MSAATPGQAAYEAFVAFQGDDDVQFETWEEKDENGDRDVMGRADWEAAAQGVIAAQEPHAAPELDLASNEMRPGELDTTLATVPPCEAISSWGMRCRVIRSHETHRDRDGNMWRPEPAAEQPAPELAALRDGITELLDGITRSAGATRPSKKTALEDEFAIALRKLLEGQ